MLARIFQRADGPLAGLGGEGKREVPVRPEVTLGRHGERHLRNIRRHHPAQLYLLARVFAPAFDRQRPFVPFEAETDKAGGSVDRALGALDALVRQGEGAGGRRDRKSEGVVSEGFHGRLVKAPAHLAEVADQAER